MVFDGKQHQPGGISCAGFFEQAGPVAVNGTGAETELIGNFGSRALPANQIQDFGLAGGEGGGQIIGEQSAWFSGRDSVFEGR